MTRQLTENFLRFILAGKSIFTLRSGKTGVRYTYKVSRSDRDQNIWFVSYLTNPDNESGYTYLGMIRGESVSPTKASKLNPNIEMWHSGHCARGGRLLTVPESIESGYGPECIGKVFANAA